MRKLICPQCLIANLYVKNSAGERLLVFVTPEFNVIPAKEDTSTEGFDLEIIYCLGCSWSGAPRHLKAY